MVDWVADYHGQRIRRGVSEHQCVDPFGIDIMAFTDDVHVSVVMGVQAEFTSDPQLIPQAVSIVGYFQRTGPMIGVSYVLIHLQL